MEIPITSATQPVSLAKSHMYFVRVITQSQSMSGGDRCKQSFRGQGGVELQNPFSGRCDSPCLTVFGATIGVLNPKPQAPNPNPRPQTQTLRETPSKMRFPAGRLALSGPSNRTRWSKLMPAPQWVFSFSGFPGLSFKCYRFRFIYKIL